MLVYELANRYVLQVQPMPSLLQFSLIMYKHIQEGTTTSMAASSHKDKK